MADTKLNQNQGETAGGQTQDASNDKLAQVLQLMLDNQKAQAEASKPPVPTTDLFVSKVPNGVFKIPNAMGTGFTLRNCHGDEVDAKGKILAESEVDGVRANA